MGAGLAVLLVVGLLVSWTYGRSQDDHVRETFRDADAAFAEAVTTISGASTVDEIAAGASTLGGVGPKLEDALRTAKNRDSDVGKTAASVLAAESAVAAAGAGLSDLSDKNLRAWIDARVELDAAVAGYADVAPERNSLASASTNLAVDQLLPHVQEVVGARAVGFAAEGLAQLFKDMDSARTTADLRQVSTRAGETAAALRAAEETFPGGSVETQRLASFASAYDTLGGLGELDAEHLDAWAGVRTSIIAEVGQFQDDESLRGRAQRACSSVDRMMANARQRIRAWRVRFDAARGERRHDGQVLSRYRDAMNRQLARYSVLRNDLSQWIARVNDTANFVTYDEGYSTLSEAEWQRREVRDAMTKLELPSRLAGVHNQLVGVIDDAIAAVQAAYQGTLDADYCSTTCYYADTPGWKLFHSESARITGAYDEAVRNWRAGMAAAQLEWQKRRMPPMPAV